MRPVNSKSLFTFICDQMEKLSANEIDVETAKAQANLCKQANNLLKYELDRSKALMELRTFNLQRGANLELREIESKPFDKTV